MKKLFILSTLLMVSTLSLAMQDLRDAANYRLQNARSSQQSLGREQYDRFRGPVQTPSQADTSNVPRGYGYRGEQSRDIQNIYPARVGSEQLHHPSFNTEKPYIGPR